jgi:hypothetical protein
MPEEASVATFAECSAYVGGYKVYVNLDSVARIEPRPGGGSIIRFAHGDAKQVLETKETPDQIAKFAGK